MDELWTFGTAAGVARLLFWIGFPVLLLVMLVLALRGAPRREAPAPGAGDDRPDPSPLLREFERTILSAERALHELPADSVEERRAKRAVLLQTLARLGNQYGRLGEGAQGGYGPLISGLQGVAARGGREVLRPGA